MNNLLKSIVHALVIPAGLIFFSCQTPAEKVDKAETEVKEANKDLKEAVKDAHTEAIKIADNAEWTIFKDQTELKIKNNQLEITELKTKLKTSAKSKDVLYIKQIEDLEQKNKDMKERLYTYEKNQSDWESFKREFGHDMDALGTALKNMTVDNKK